MDGSKPTARQLIAYYYYFASHFCNFFFPAPLLPWILDSSYLRDVK